MNRIINHDEKWILYDNCKLLASCLDKDEVPKHSPKRNIHQKKLVVAAWWRSHDLIYCGFIKPSHSITAETYLNQLDDIIQNLVEKRARLENRDSPVKSEHWIWHWNVIIWKETESRMKLLNANIGLKSTRIFLHT